VVQPTQIMKRIREASLKLMIALMQPHTAKDVQVSIIELRLFDVNPEDIGQFILWYIETCEKINLSFFAYISSLIRIIINLIIDYINCQISNGNEAAMFTWVCASQLCRNILSTDFKNWLRNASKKLKLFASMSWH
jgi:hypothetical protein